MNNMIEKLRKAIRCFGELLSILVFTPIGRFMRLCLPSCRNVWLISERGNEARDNAYHLFKYVTQTHPEIRAYYVISRRSPDRARVAEIGHIVSKGSIRHRLLMGAAERLISTHIMGYTPDLGAYFRLDRFRLVPGIKVFLQHGITKDNVSFMHYPNTRCDLFVCAAEDEYQFIMNNFGHADGVAQLLGFCRFDALLGKSAAEKRQILLMPTWREWLALHDAGDFTETTYYKAISAFLNAPRLSTLLEQFDYELAFYPHVEMHRFLHLFASDCPRVRILPQKGNDVQKLLIESKLLITDYSSVFFDFAFMGKPEIFYQFDEKEFRARQYQEGYFSYRRDAFGPVCAALDETLDALEVLLKNDCVMPGEYRERLDRFFTFRDERNCERNYQAICALNRHKE